LTTNPNHPSKSQDMLYECLQFSLSVFGMNADIDSVLSDVAREAGALQPNDVLEVAKRLNVKAHIKTKSLKQIQALDVPCIVLLKNKQAEVLLPAKTHQNKSYKPGTGIVRKDLARIEDLYVGKVIILYPMTSLDTQDVVASKPIDWIWRPIREHWRTYSEIMLCSLFINIFALTIPLFTMNVYDRVVPNFATDTLIVLTIGILCALAFDFLFKTTRAHILETLSSKIGTVFDFELMERLLNIRTIHMPHSIGEQANLFKEIQSLRDFYATRLAPSLVDFPFFILFLIVIANISGPLVVIPIIASIVILSLNILVHIPIKMRTARYFENMQNKSALLVETLAGSQTLKMFNGIGQRLFQWNVISGQSASSARNVNVLMSWVQSASVSVMHMVNVFVVFFGVYQINAGTLTVGGLIACTILSARAIAPVLALGGTFSSMKHAHDVLQTIHGLFRLPHESHAKAKITKKSAIRGDVAFRNVSYAYPDQSMPALNDVSFKIQSGEKVGIIGKTGAGKSTIAGLLTGVLEHDAGSILIDDYALQSFHPVELRRNLGIVPQQSFFFRDTLRNNILLGQQDISEDHFNRIAEISGLDLYIKQSGQSFDTDIGENGSKLSGGQKQAIAIARALIGNPDIVMMDEPTNGMDQTLEGMIKTTLATHLDGKTLILITHRTSLLSLVDRLILVDRGQIIADGPRDEVMKKLSGTS